MTREERIINFTSQLRKWVSRKSSELLDFYEKGREDSKRAEIIKQDIQMAYHISAMFFNEWYVVEDLEGNLKYSFLDEEDYEIEKLISDYSFRMGINTSAYGGFPLLSLNLTEAQQVQTSVNGLPAGGGPGQLITQDGSGNPVWVSFDQIEDNFEV